MLSNLGSDEQRALQRSGLARRPRRKLRTARMSTELRALNGALAHSPSIGRWYFAKPFEVMECDAVPGAIYAIQFAIQFPRVLDGIDPVAVRRGAFRREGNHESGKCNGSVWKGVRMTNTNRWGIAAAGFLMQVALGAVYAWSVFRIPLSKSFGWSIPQVTLTFTIAIFVLGVAAFLGGLWLNKKGPRVVALTGGFLYCLGVFLASFSAHKLWWLYLSYGLIG